MHVTFCKRNLQRHGPETSAALQEAAGSSEVKECLDRCLTCDRAAIALVDGAFVGAKTPGELIEQLRAAREG